MSVKIDTKEKFTVITPDVEVLSVNVAETISQNALSNMASNNRNIVLKLADVKTIKDEAAEHLAALQQQFYQSNASFVICELQPEVKVTFEKLELPDHMNITNTESEAWDIIQMEEIERELLGNDDF